MRPVSAIVLAAGLSRRAGEENKLLWAWKDTTVVNSCVRTALQVGYASVTVVLGHEEALVRQALTDVAERVEWVTNERFEEGVGTTIAAGVASVPERHAVAVLLGDMPRVPLRHLADLRTAFRVAPPGAIIVSGDGRWQGCPALFGHEYRHELLALQGDRGARSILRAHPECLVEIRAADPAWLEDVDGI